jgi:hypothetical protein
LARAKDALSKAAKEWSEEEQVRGRPESREEKKAESMLSVE